MSDTEAFIERLTAENHDFRTLREEHQRYELELAALNALAFHYVTYPSVVAREDTRALPFGAGLAGVLGLVLWATVIIEGRLIPYALVWFPEE